MKKIFLGLVVLGGLVFGGDKIEINAPTVMCYNKNSEHGKFTLMYIISKGDKSVLKGIKKDSNGDCQALSSSPTNTIVGTILERQKDIIAENKITNEMPFEHIKLKVLSIAGKKVKENMAVWIVSLSMSPCYTILK